MVFLRLDSTACNFQISRSGMGLKAIRCLGRDARTSQGKEYEMRIIELILLLLGALTAAFSITNRRLPRGVIEWGIWIADIVIIVMRLIGR